MYSEVSNNKERMRVHNHTKIKILFLCIQVIIPNLSLPITDAGCAILRMIVVTTRMSKRICAVKKAIENALNPNFDVPMTNVFQLDGSVTTMMTVAITQMNRIALIILALQRGSNVQAGIASKKS